MTEMSLEKYANRIRADVQRMGACYRACEAIPTEALVAGVVKELLEACKLAIRDEGRGGISPETYQALVDVIAKAKPEKKKEGERR